MVAPQVQSDAEAHQNAALYTDTGNCLDSNPNDPFGVASADALYAGQSLQDAPANLSATVKNGDGSDASFQADIAAAEKMSRRCSS